LADYPTRVEQLVVEVDDPRALSETEKESLLRVCRKTNMVIYSSRIGAIADKAIPRKLGKRFGLRRLDPNMLADDDGITSLQVVPGKAGRGYIPYSNRRLLWHTDGYYNPPDRRILALLLHCVSPAAEGGESRLLDHEIVYILMRDENPAYIDAFMQPDAMTIPANMETGQGTRPAETGPVFFVDGDGNLQMRYTARTRSIAWRSDPTTRSAVRFLDRLLNSESPYTFRCTMQSGQGLISNNVLHNRTGFEDRPEQGMQRLIYRARYYDRVAGTNLNVLGRAQGP